jgi:hypothetical protein
MSQSKSEEEHKFQKKKKTKVSADIDTTRQKQEEKESRLSLDEPPNPPDYDSKSLLSLEYEKELEKRKRLGTLYDERVNTISSLTEEERKGKKNLLIVARSFISDVRMRPECIGCDLRHHILTKDERKSIVNMLNSIAMRHEKSSMKKFFREYKDFGAIECICLAKECPYGFFHGEKIE